MILIRPTGGLCNRIRMMDSTVLLARQIHKPVKVLWTLGPELNCGFYLLFETFSDVEATEVRSAQAPKSPLQGKLHFMAEYLRFRRACPRVIFQSEMDRLLKRNFDFTQLATYESVFITCCNRFYRPERKLQPFVPAASIRQTVERYASQFGDNTVGVHIRRTDHHTVTGFSPEQGFIEAMNAEIEQDPQTRFFLATDSPGVLKKFTAIFGSRLSQHPKEYNRNHPSGIQDAMVDLLCLSRTKKIIGSRLSSFSETAAQINDIPLMTIRGD